MAEANGTGAEWSATALAACLRKLLAPRIWENPVPVVRSWTDGPDAFCVVYESPYAAEGTMVGLRRTKSDSQRCSTYQLGGMTESPFIDDPDDPDPTQFGDSVAYFDISEPLAVRDILRYGADGVGWWGTLETALPRLAAH